MIVRRLVRKFISTLLLSTMVASIAGCRGGNTKYIPKVVAHSELTLRYNDRVEMYAGKKFLTHAPKFKGLRQHVRCVPEAVEHAEQAQEEGESAMAMSWTGGALGIAGLGGLAGLGYLNKDDTAAGLILGSGVLVGLIGVVLAGIGRSKKNTANGHAVDALNYYNDAVGSLGRSCDQPKQRGPVAAPAIPRIRVVPVVPVAPAVAPVAAPPAVRPAPAMAPVPMPTVTPSLPPPVQPAPPAPRP